MWTRPCRCFGRTRSIPTEKADRPSALRSRSSRHFFCGPARRESVDRRHVGSGRYGVGRTRRYRYTRFAVSGPAGRNLYYNTVVNTFTRIIIIIIIDDARCLRRPPPKFDCSAHSRRPFHHWRKLSECLVPRRRRSWSPKRVSRVRQISTLTNLLYSPDLLKPSQPRKHRSDRYVTEAQHRGNPFTD